MSVAWMVPCARRPRTLESSNSDIGESSVLLNGADLLLQPLNSFLNLAVGELDERAGFSESIFKIGSIVGITPAEMQLESFGDKLEVMTESLGQNVNVTPGTDYFDPKGLDSSIHDKLSVSQRSLGRESQGINERADEITWPNPPTSVSSAQISIREQNSLTE